MLCTGRLPLGFVRGAGGSFQLHATGSSNGFHICVARDSVMLAAGRENDKRPSIFALDCWKIASAVG